LTVSTKDQLLPGAFSPDDLNQIRNAVRERYSDTARSAEGKFRYPTGREGAGALGYNPDVIARMPEELINSFCGVGNPFSLADIRAGSVLLDIGCGTGFDLVVASDLVGPEGRVHGTDLTGEMVRSAEAAISQLGIANAEVVQVDSDELPYHDTMFDVIISNGVINLSPCKRDLFKDIFRVLKPGGMLQFADIVQEGKSPGEKGANLAAWAQ
jgi:arsenite methyltransferase